MNENIIEIVNGDVILEIENNSFDLLVDDLYVNDYFYSQNKPSINGVVLDGDKSAADFGIANKEELYLKEDLANKIVALSEDVDDNMYLSAKCVKEELLLKAGIDLENLSESGLAKFNSKADIDGSNMSESITKFDGNWVNKSFVVASGVTAPTSTDLSYDLSSYLPDDEYIYEVLFSMVGTTAASSSAYSYGLLSSNIIVNSVAVYNSRVAVGSTNAVRGAGNIVLPVGTDRSVFVNAVSVNTGVFTLSAFGYRRLGTNC